MRVDSHADDDDDDDRSGTNFERASGNSPPADEQLFEGRGDTETAD